MTRFGVMKHLKVLEEAGLVVARRRGRVNTCRAVGYFIAENSVGVSM